MASNVKLKYLKDESGNKLSPITSTKSIYLENNQTPLSSYYVIAMETIYKGNIDIPADTTRNITITKPLNGFDYIIYRFNGKVNIFEGSSTHGILHYFQHPNDSTKREWLLNWNTTTGSKTITLGYPQFQDVGGYTQAYQITMSDVIGILLRK